MTRNIIKAFTKRVWVDLTIVISLQREYRKCLSQIDVNVLWIRSLFLLYRLLICVMLDVRRLHRTGYFRPHLTHSAESCSRARGYVNSSDPGALQEKGRNTTWDQGVCTCVCPPVFVCGGQSGGTEWFIKIDGSLCPGKAAALQHRGMSRGPGRPSRAGDYLSHHFHSCWCRISK